MRRLAFACVPVLLAAAAPSQQAVLFAVDSDTYTLDLAGGLAEAGLLRPDEIGIVTPRSGGSYSARTFLSMGAQWAYLGDHDQDGMLVDAETRGPGEATDAILVLRRNPPSSFGPNDVFVSKSGTQGFDTNSADGDVFRYLGQGSILKFVTEAQLLTALGQAPTDDVDLDAICQTSAGDLAMSFRATESVSGTMADDGSVIMIPAAAITYSAIGLVSAMAPSSALIFATEADLGAMITQSGVLGANAVAPPTAFDLTGLDVDPAGGSWSSPQSPGRTLPNLVFAWSGSDGDAAVLSTGAGGRIARVNGVQLGSATATTGLHLGLLPGITGVDGLGGLGLIPSTPPPPPVVENHPSNLILSTTGLYTRQEVSGATPGALVVFAVDVGPSGSGASLPIRNVPPFGQAYGLGAPVTTGITLADTRGYASYGLLLPAAAVGMGINVAWQAFDVGTLRLTTPAAMQFQ